MTMQFAPASPDNEAIRNIRDLAKTQSKQTNWIIGLTVVLAILALIQVIILLKPVF